MVVAFLDGGLAAADLPAVESHLEACGACADLVTWAAADQAHRSRSAGREGRPFVGQLAPGSRVDRYQILSAVGRGGMGEVYAAYHPDLDRRIALKVVGESAANAPEQRARLLREARAIARLSHPNVVAVYDAGTVDDRVYIAMEFVEGETVDQWLRSKPRGWREILDVFIAAGRGLAAAHAAGVVHRDFKPQNVMVGRDGSVRVMDFGLARLAEEPADTADAGSAADASPLPATVTKTGALVGTLAYMSPEQFRGEKVDARADQFSFCVALHEALYGTRPILSHLAAADDGGITGRNLSVPSSASGAPAWLRTTIARGLSPDRNQRFASMEALLVTINRGRTRVRRRVSVLSTGFAVLALSLGGWRLASARRVSCVVPHDRLTGAWLPRDESDPRRQAIHRAFSASGRETSWRRVSKILDDYVTQWSAAYVQTCEATHVRGEQSGEALDLRMSCLAENLDEVRALTDVLQRADQDTVSHSLTAAQGLTSINRCEDLALLRSRVPLPRDAQKRAAVENLRASLRDVQALVDIGNRQAAARVGTQLLPRVEAVGYQPLLAELRELIGVGEEQADPRAAELMLESAFFTAERSGDDPTAARAASELTYVVGYQLGRHAEAKRWAQVGEAILDRIGRGQDRIRAWLLNNYAAVLAVSGEWDEACQVTEKAVSLKELSLGTEHPDVAISLSNLAQCRANIGEPERGLDAVNRAIEIYKHGDPDTSAFANVHANKADLLLALGRHREAGEEFAVVLGALGRQPESYPEHASQALHGLGEVRLALEHPSAAIHPLEQALVIREHHEIDPCLTADTRFALAEALWESGGNNRRARSLASAARNAYAQKHRSSKERAVVKWLAEHKRTVSDPSLRHG